MKRRRTLLFALLLLSLTCGALWLFRSGYQGPPAAVGRGASAEAAAQPPAVAATTERESPAEVDATPPDPGHPDPVDGPERERVLGPETVVHVRDETSRGELIGVELRTLPAVFASSDRERPDGGRAFAVATGAVSPIRIRPWRWSDDAPDRGRGYLVADAGGGDAADVTTDLYTTLRGHVLFARTANTAWGRVHVDLSEGGEYQVLCGSAATLRVSFENAQPDAYSKLGRPVYLVAHRSGEPVAELPLHEPEFRLGVTLDGLKSGAFELKVVMGNWWEHRSRHDLGRVERDVVAGDDVAVTIDLDDPPAPIEKAGLAGALAFPPFPGEPEVVLRLFHCDLYSQGPATAEIPLAEMTRDSPSGRVWRFDAGEIPVGLYQAKVWPLLCSFSFELPANGKNDLLLDIPAIAEVDVTVRDPMTGSPYALPELFWSCRQTIRRMANFVGTDVPPVAPGRFRFHTIPGRVELMAQPPDGARVGFTERIADVHAGANAIDFELATRQSVQVVFRAGGVVLPVGELHTRAELRTLEGDGEVVYSRAATDGAWDLSAPGLYEVSFPKIGPPEYRPVPPREVRLEAGESIAITVDLEHP